MKGMPRSRWRAISRAMTTERERRSRADVTDQVDPFHSALSNRAKSRVLSAECRVHHVHGTRHPPIGVNARCGVGALLMSHGSQRSVVARGVIAACQVRCDRCSWHSAYGVLCAHASAACVAPF